MSPPLILASTSRYRAELLQRLRLPFTQQAPGCDEHARAGESPRALAERLARAKSDAIARLHPEALVLGSDQVADLDGTVLGKPGDAASAQRQLAAASGRCMVFHTAWVLQWRAGERRWQGCDETRALLRPLDADAIARYVAADQPWDCAGSFRAEALGIALFERIESSDPTALIGLPLIAVAAALRAAGLTLP